jgi:formylglycine-generating enzyme required for sulfatase activity
MKTSLAQQRISVFQHNYGTAAIDLACHAAFPMALTSELVYCLRENFADLKSVPWYAAADVVQSGLCNPIGYDLYEMSPEVRSELLKMLTAKFKQQRIEELEALMGDYILNQLDLEQQKSDLLGIESKQRSRILGDVPHWTTLCCLNPGKAKDTIRQELQRIYHSSERDRLHLSAMTESYGNLIGSPILLEWADALADDKLIESEWTDWAAQYGIKLTPQVVQVARIRFDDEPLPPETNRDPNLLRTFEFTVVKLNVQGKEKQRVIKQASYFIEPLEEGITPLELVAIPGGEFMMGSLDEKERHEDERPQHLVKVPPFFMAKYPVTQSQWRYVATSLPQVQRKLAPEPSKFKGDDLPVEQVSWLDAVEFCQRVSIVSGRICRLPTEAEWEYACRAGTTTPFHFGETISTAVANYDGNYTYGRGKKGEYREQTTPVGSFGVANDFGLFDLHGNVWEWCEDHWHENYEGAPINGSSWLDLDAAEDAFRVLRGGSWFDNPGLCRSAFRFRNLADIRDFNVGFRVVYSPARTS